VTKDLGADGRKWWWCEVSAERMDDLDVGGAELELPGGERHAVTVSRVDSIAAVLKAYGDAPVIPVLR
jgi:hypothetical protein